MSAQAIPASRLAVLARAMGYEAEVDAAGYGVERVIARRKGFAQVWSPQDDGKQCLSVMAWMLDQHPHNRIDGRSVGHAMPTHFDSEDHDGSATGIAAAIVDAACRVAEGMEEGK